ncbi:MAG: c-type cytochrome [Betaproteobacteria bacterium]|nr:MAG: c-type cytochrome [Betaproteobacteria bacterium]
MTVKPMTVKNRWRHSTPALWLLAGYVFLSPGYGSVTAAEPGSLDRGKSLYEFYCYQCHAYSGNANTVAATYLTPKPRDFSRTDPALLSREQMLDAVRAGKPGTAMTSFARVLSSGDMAAVVDYVRSNLMGSQRPELAYHTPANGWEDHQRYEPAFVFALGTVPIDTAWEELSPKQRIGRKLFLSACITCHEPRRVDNEPLKFEPRAVSYPRSTDTCIDCHAGRPRELLPLSKARPNALTGNKGAESLPNFLEASPYLIHGRPKQVQNLSESELRGKELFLAHCAFCHAADGSSKNWIGSFLEPRPRELRPEHISNTKSSSYLRAVIRDGIPGTSMPSWKNVLTERETNDLVEFLAIDAGHPVEPVAREAAQSTQSGGAAPQWIKSVVND